MSENQFHMVHDEITRLRSRIEELKRERITDDQIDKAWEYAETRGELRILWHLGIFACEKCGGSRKIKAPTCTTSLDGSVKWHSWPCPDCYRNGKSHGWVRRNDE